MDIDIFLKKFEIEMRELEYPEDKWTFLLSRSFTAEVPSKICMNQGNYSIVKEQLLRTFGKTEAFYRQQFVNCEIEPEDDPQTFLDKMSSHFDNWIETAEVEKTFDSLKTFLMLDKVMYECQEELKIFLLERKPKSIEDIVRLIRAYKVAHPEKKLSRGSDIEEIVAFNRTCETQNNSHRTRETQDRQYRSGTYERQNDSRNVRYQGNRQERKDWEKGRIEQGLSLSSDTGTLEIFQTFVGNKAAKTIRDTRSTIIGVNKNLVEDHEYTGESRKCVMFNGNIVQLPIAKVSIDTPYVKGTVEACVVDQGEIDLIIGNINGVKICSVREIENWKKYYGIKSTRGRNGDVEEDIRSHTSDDMGSREHEKKELTDKVESNAIRMGPNQSKVRQSVVQGKRYKPTYRRTNPYILCFNCGKRGHIRRQCQQLIRIKDSRYNSEEAYTRKERDISSLENSTARSLGSRITMGHHCKGGKWKGWHVNNVRII
ncbi:uncharacterized protein LOC129927202 [Biomphalaria glabrata]|uniref:Uncharacterized protein LOC129927202 n=1 Tax=Biomphalaria glabrata TaxID=6526 RepID=A0A9W3ATT8_BIOGL|nr:uncharacterized protein LOC129927202 [Biomphalaria glabrata]